MRLRGRYAELVAAIDRRVSPDRQEQLKAEAERLNPDTWVTPEHVRAALDQYEAVFESLRGSIGRRRRRRRPRSSTGTAESSAQPPAPAETGSSNHPDSGGLPGLNDDTEPEAHD